LYFIQGEPGLPVVTVVMVVMLVTVVMVAIVVAPFERDLLSHFLLCYHLPWVIQTSAKPPGE
jgi:hypothetical protein